jgi:hypothetical protein
MTTKIKPGRGTPTTVEEALDRYWKCNGIPGNVPDYVGFAAWLTEKKEAAQAVVVPLHMETKMSPGTMLALELIKAAQHAGIEITRDGPIPLQNKFGKSDGKKPWLKCFNRAKLMLWFFRELSGRERDSYFAIAASWKNADEATTITQDSSQAEHRMAFLQLYRSAMPTSHLRCSAVYARKRMIRVNWSS